MSALSRDEAREQIARAMWVADEQDWSSDDGGIYAPTDEFRDVLLNLADDALTVLWPVVESLRDELAHAHTVIARHVEPLRKPCRPEAGDCCDGDAHTWQPAQGSRLPDRVDGNRPSDALYGDLTGEACGSGVSGRDGQDAGA